MIDVLDSTIALNTNKSSNGSELVLLDECHLVSIARSTTRFDERY